MSYIQNPSSIEETSFKLIQAIIDEEFGGRTFGSEIEESIIKRAIHTSGDFDYLDNMVFTHGVTNKIQGVLKNQGTLILDSNISLQGINKRVLDQMNVSYKCLIDNDEVRNLAKEKGITRAMAAVEVAARISGPKLFAFGGAPTALSYLLELFKSGLIKADAVIGLPVGFINVEESKEELLSSSLPALVSRGRKGGSTIVVSTINAIIYQMKHVVTEDYIRYATPDNKKERR
ncbi:cobalt-precorrin-8X methylmutase [Streptococcus varani]|uniref:Cobalt-precorrin-8X methylmutase n=1 Tax=Streptococcus varani TaxID=1608583 RepID=A0A0E3WFJ6_9STRE|nr:precorrin-8X methylmutase [Streptococcus varani]CQR25637.1 cobalt-precorrin-8X methylmutase [Streptococcus varani]